MASSGKASQAKAAAHAPTVRGHAARPGRRRQTAKLAPASKRALGGAAESAATGPVVLGSALTIAEVAQAARGFTSMLAGGTAHTDARALASIDTAGLQLLLAAAAAAQDCGLKLALHGAPELLAAAAHSLGVGGELASAMERSA